MAFKVSIKTSKLTLRNNLSIPSLLGQKAIFMSESLKLENFARVLVIESVKQSSAQYAFQKKRQEILCSAMLKINKLMERWKESFNIDMFRNFNLVKMAA